MCYGRTWTVSVLLGSNTSGIASFKLFNQKKWNFRISRRVNYAGIANFGISAFDSASKFWRFSSISKFKKIISYKVWNKPILLEYSYRIITFCSVNLEPCSKIKKDEIRRLDETLNAILENQKAREWQCMLVYV